MPFWCTVPSATRPPSNASYLSEVWIHNWLGLPLSPESFKLQQLINCMHCLNEVALPGGMFSTGLSHIVGHTPFKDSSHDIVICLSFACSPWEPSLWLIFTFITDTTDATEIGDKRKRGSVYLVPKAYNYYCYMEGIRGVSRLLQDRACALSFTWRGAQIDLPTTERTHALQSLPRKVPWHPGHSQCQLGQNRKQLEHTHSPRGSWGNFLTREATGALIA